MTILPDVSDEMKENLVYNQSLRTSKHKIKLIFQNDEVFVLNIST